MTDIEILERLIKLKRQAITLLIDELVQLSVRLNELKSPLAPKEKP